MGAFKKLQGHYLYIDMTNIHVPSWKIYALTKASLAKQRAIRKIDPFAHVIGPKRKYETAAEFKAACDEYFKSQECYVYDKFGQPIKDPITGKYIKSTKPLTLSGLGLHIGLATATLRHYRAIARSGTIDPEYAAVILEALQHIESYAERRAYDRDGQRGGEFILKTGFNWRTEKEKRESEKIKVETSIAKEKLRMQREEHQLKIELLRAGLEGDEDSDINITITRAKKKDD